MPVKKNESREAIVVIAVNRIGQPVSPTAAIRASRRFPHRRNWNLKAFIK
jgi:hypothetical protein